MEWKSLKLGTIFPKIKNVSERKSFKPAVAAGKIVPHFFQLEHKVGQRDFVDKAGERLAARLDRGPRYALCCTEL